MPIAPTKEAAPLAASISTEERIMSHFIPQARKRLRDKDFQPLAQAMVKQYLDTISALMKAAEGQKPEKLPPDVLCREYGSALIFTSTCGSNWSARLAEDGAVTVRKGSTTTTFTFSGATRNDRSELVRVVIKEDEGKRSLKSDHVNLCNGSRHKGARTTLEAQNGAAPTQVQVTYH